MVIAALFTIAKIGKQPKHPSTDGWIKTTHTHTHTHRDTHTHTHTYTYWNITQLYKKKKKCYLQQHGWT